MPVNVAPEESIQLSFTITASKCDGPVHGKVLFKVRDDGALSVRYTPTIILTILCVCAAHIV